MSAVTKIEPRETQAVQMIDQIERIALNPDLPIERLEQMLALKERMEAKAAKAEHADALANAMEEMPNVPMSGRGNNNKPYSTLKDITSTTRPVLAKHGLSLTFDVKMDSGFLTVTAKLTHRNGHETTVSLPLPIDTSGSKNNVQGVGSSQTYGQRYTAQAILGLSLGDDTEDDGRASNAPESVSAEQYIKLRDALEESGMPPVKFHTAFGHSDPENADLQMFPARRFKEALNRLEAYKKAKDS